MQNSLNGVMTDHGLWFIIGGLVVILLIVAIIKVAQKK